MSEQQPRTIRLPHVEQRRTHRRTGAETVGLHHHRVCETTGKLRYRDSHQVAHALEGARRLRAAQTANLDQVTRHEVRSYRCDSCGGFHLTSQDRGPRGWRAARGELTAGDPVSVVPTGRSRRRRIAAMAAVAAACAA